MSSTDFFNLYLRYTHDTEATATFHRWAAIVGIGALLEKTCWIQFGNSHIYPNQYVMLMGESGTRKSSAIKAFVKILKATGYNYFSATKTSKEKFLQDLAAMHHEDADLDTELFGSDLTTSVTPCLIAADEANDFFGINNVEFLSILGNLWDIDGAFENKIKTGKSDWIPNPNISILAGNTPTNFAAAFPPTLIGQGFFSRLLIVQGERTRPKIAWPEPPKEKATAAIVQLLMQIKTVMCGPLEVTPEAKKLAAAIYESTDYGTDERFRSYFERRQTHLLKLSIICAAANLRPVIDEEAILQANTFLTYIQNLMPKALGAYGKSKNSDVVQKIVSFIYSSGAIGKIVAMPDIWKQVDKDLESPSELTKIIQGLLLAERIQGVAGGFLPNHGKKIEDTVIENREARYIDLERYLTTEELGVKT